MVSENRRKLVLVRHSLPQMDRNAQRNLWHLSDEGRRRCNALAEALAGVAPRLIASSTEPKAVQTANIVAERLDTPHREFEGLHEHDRSNVEFLPAEDFDPAIASFFASPDELVLGKETASQAHKRFSGAVQAVLAEAPDGNVAIVSHGTVMALFVAKWAGIEAVTLWRRLGLPSLVELSLPEFELISVTEEIR